MENKYDSDNRKGTIKKANSTYKLKEVIFNQGKKVVRDIQRQEE